MSQLQSDQESMAAKLSYEHARYKDLESVLVQERRAGHELKLEIEDLKRST